MKKLAFAVGALALGGAVLLAQTPCGSPAYAMSGCCKQRGSDDKRWRVIGRDLKKCKRENARKDQDNVFQPSGRVWWDSKC